MLASGRWQRGSWRSTIHTVGAGVPSARCRPSRRTGSCRHPHPRAACTRHPCSPSQRAAPASQAERRKQKGPCGPPARPRRLLGRGGPALGAARVRLRRRQERYLAEDVPLWLRRCGGTDGMICTGLGSPYSMFVPALRATALLPTAGAATKPCESALTRYSICAVGDGIGRG